MQILQPQNNPFKNTERYMHVLNVCSDGDIYAIATFAISVAFTCASQLSRARRLSHLAEQLG